VATISGLISRVRLELGDQGKSFVESFVADGTTNRFKLNHSPLDGPGLIVRVGGVDVSSTSFVEESTGILVVATVPADGVEILVSGTYFRYFTDTELGSLVTDAVTQHSSGHTDTMGSKITVSNLPANEEYAVSIYAVTLALYTLATDAAFDIDIQAPDGVAIPRSERYRQLMDMVQARQNQYRDLCVLLGIGLYSVDVLTFRRISKATGRYVPVYRPQEVDDRSYPQRVHDNMPSYGDKAPAWPTYVGDFNAYQGRAFTTTLTFTGTYDVNTSYVANVLNQRGSVLVIQNCTLTVTGPVSGTYTATITLSDDQTMFLAQRTYLSLGYINYETNETETIEIAGGNLFTQRLSEVVL